MITFPHFISEFYYQQPDICSWHGMLYFKKYVLLIKTLNLSILLTDFTNRTFFPQKNTFISANDVIVPVEFFEVSLKRAIVLTKGSTTEVRIKIIENTGEFSIVESGKIHFFKD